MQMAPHGSVLQVCHVVRDLEAAIGHWTGTLGAGPFYVHRFQIDGQIYRRQPASLDATIAIGYLGQTNIELAMPMDDSPSVFNDLLLTRGPGLHHFWLAADDMDAEIARLESVGCPMIGYGETPGFTRSAMMDTSAVLGCFTEIQVCTPRVWEILGEMQKTHATWDRSDPIRPYPAL